MKKIIIFLSGLFFSISLVAQQIPPCNSWFNTNNGSAGAAFFTSNNGINVTGTQLTVEALFYRTDNTLPGFLVSKHTDASNVNYALFPHGCAITTTTGGVTREFFALETCPTDINRTYHVAMVYDGATLSFYRDGFLQSQIPATGNLVTNNLTTTIGRNSPNAGTPVFPFLGYINEVRFWNVARTQAQLQTFMYASLPNPPAQQGLLAYYNFNSLLNQQGNALFNGTLVPANNALINQTIPTCVFTPVACCAPNTSTNVTKCSNQSTVLNARTGTTYLWSPASGLSATNIQSPVCSATTNITYTVTVFNAVTNCTNTDIFNVTVNPAPVSNMPDTTLCKGDTIQLLAGLGNTYSWSPNYNISNLNIQNPLVWPAVTTDYTVIITNAYGCSANDTVKVIVNDCGCEDSCNWSLTGNTHVKGINFIGSKNTADFIIRTNNIQRMVVSANGNVGVNTNTPTAKLHINSLLENGQTNPSNIRVENLQTGIGANLVIDADGYVYKSKPILRGEKSDIEILYEELEKTRQEVQELKQQIEKLFKTMNVSPRDLADKPVLIGCYPNPAADRITVRYYLPEGSHSAICNIINLEGKTLKSYNLNTVKGYGELTIQTNELGISAGILMYSLIVNTVLIDAQKVVIGK